MGPHTTLVINSPEVHVLGPYDARVDIQGSFVLCDQSDAFMQQHPGLKMLITALEKLNYKYIEDELLQYDYGCPCHKVVGIMWASP